MDYKEEYNAIVQRCRELHESGNALTKQQMEIVCPQLKDSEDERIRKALIQFLTDIKDISESGRTSWAVRKDDAEMCNGFLAYLERQKEQKPAEKQDYSGLNDLELAIHRGFLCAGVENVPVTIIKETARDCLAQMKPAEWSEEDKHCIHQLILFCENCMQQDSEAIRCANWLKSLRPQSVQDKFDEAMHVADKFEEGYKAGVYDTKAKSWKPSEEQMEAVEEALEFYSGTTDTAKGLRSLYNDLKKL